jgi:hypothetical protein
LRAGGFRPNTTLRVSGQRINDQVNVAMSRNAGLLSTIALGAVTTDATGTVDLALFFPPSLEAGSYLLNASDGTTTVEATIVVDPTAEIIPDTGTLPVLQFATRLAA